MRLTPGVALGQYEISDSIGAGGMGEVYRARDTRLGREVAIKVLPREVAADRERLTRFEREAQSASALNHPNIVTIHDFATAGDDCYLVMELIRGESLRALLSRGPLPQKRLYTIAAGIADGLAAAHASGIIHRDLKPENVMITGEGTPKILDFGLVKPTPSPGDSATEVKVTSSGAVLGTATYMAPEQARGIPVGIQADQFSLGLILHEMATGRHPFGRANTFETVSAILNDDPPPLGDSFPEPFTWIVERCLSKDPSERYASTSDLARDLATLRDRMSAPEKRRIAQLRKSSRRSWMTAVLVALALLAAGALAMLIVQRPRTAVQGPIQVTVATPQIDVQMGEVAIPVVISPDGRKLVVSGTGANGRNDLWVHDLESGDARLIAENAFGPGWSHDSKQIAYFADGKLKTVPVDGGPGVEVCDALPEGAPTWWGDSILFGRYSGGPNLSGIYRVDARGGKPERLQVVSVQSWWPQLLPDGKHFLYMALDPGDGASITHKIMLGSLDGGPAKRVAALDSAVQYVDGRALYVRDGSLLAQTLDIERARLVGEPSVLAENVDYFRSTGMAAFSVSRNGILAWRASRKPVRLVWLDRGGMELETIGTALFHSDGRLSADGNQYAVSIIDGKQGVGDLWIYDLARGSSERLTFGHLDQIAPIWLPDGRTLFYRTDGFGGPPDIAAMRPGAGNATLVLRGPAVEHPEDVSPDGKWLLYTTYSHVTSDIHVLRLDPPGEPLPFAKTPFAETSPRFSQDGRWVAYASNLSGRSEVYVRPFEGTQPSIRVSKDGGMRPRWSHDGRDLFFLGPAGRLMSATFDGKTFGTPRMLFQAANARTFEPHPDGKRFLVQLDEHRGEPPVHLLINWQARLNP